MTVCVVIPWRPDGSAERDRALDYVLGRYRHEHPDWQVRIGTCRPGPWSKGLAVWDAVRSTNAEVLILADADAWSDGTTEAVTAVQDGAAYAIPHSLVKRLTAQATHDVLNGRAGEAFDERPYPGMPGGGLVVLPRATYLTHPIDPRFEGWGQEDEVLGRVLHASLGRPWRGTADLIHLWHPPAPRLTRSRGNPDGWRLRRRYLQARWDPAHLADLLKEARDALDLDQPALHHPSPRQQCGEDTVRPAA